MKAPELPTGYRWWVDSQDVGVTDPSGDVVAITPYVPHTVGTEYTVLGMMDDLLQRFPELQSRLVRGTFKGGDDLLPERKPFTTSLKG